MAADGGSAPSSAPTLPCSFSPRSRHYLAVCAQDGRLRIWNADSRALHREYVPSAHLSATCTCIAWGPCLATKVHTVRAASPSCASLPSSSALRPPWHLNTKGASCALPSVLDLYLRRRVQFFSRAERRACATQHANFASSDLCTCTTFMTALDRS